MWHRWGVEPGQHTPLRMRCESQNAHRHHRTGERPRAAQAVWPPEGRSILDKQNLKAREKEDWLHSSQTVWVALCWEADSEKGLKLAKGLPYTQCLVNADFQVYVAIQNLEMISLCMQAHCMWTKIYICLWCKKKEKKKAGLNLESLR